jgi:hypothetical protein
METHCETCTCYRVKRATRVTLPTLNELSARKITPARATALRAMQRKLCSCNRCIFAERDVSDPASTFVEWNRRMTEWAEIVTTPDAHKTWAQILGN